MKRSRPSSPTPTSMQSSSLISSTVTVTARNQEDARDPVTTRAGYNDDDNDDGKSKSSHSCVCWKCKGHGQTRNKSNPHLYNGKKCPICQGTGQIQASSTSQKLAEQPGRIMPLRGQDGQGKVFAGVPAVTTDTTSTIANKGEILAPLGCGDWRIWQLANGHKLTVDDFCCAWVAAEEMRQRGYGLVTTGQFGQVLGKVDTTIPAVFHHADLGCGCGSVLMMMAWAFPHVIRSHGVEAQQVSFDLCRRGLQWNLGHDGSSSTANNNVQVSHQDLRTWNGGSLQPYDVITGTPPYFPADRFAASPNHPQKVRCRIPTRGAAADYVAAAARLVKVDTGVICIAETARAEGEQGMRLAIQEHKLQVIRRLDVITRTGLPPRFSIWVLKKPGTSDVVPTSQSDKEKPSCRQEAEPQLASEKPSTNANDDFTIETLTIRNQDQSRTLEYVDCMERMGWVDFEKTREKHETKALSLGTEK